MARFFKSDYSRIIKDALILKSFAPPTIHFTYRAMVEVIPFLPKTINGVTCASLMVYGWMPTMMRLKGEASSIHKLVVSAQTNIDKMDLAKAAESLNNSVVGVSKLLHFFYPEKYPIWDSRVLRAIKGKTPFQYELRSEDNYLNYITWLHGLIACPEIEILQKSFERECGYSVSKVRVAEAVLYALGGKP